MWVPLDRLAALITLKHWVGPDAWRLSVRAGKEQVTCTTHPLVPILPCLTYPYMKRGRHPTNHGGDREQVGLAKTMQGGGWCMMLQRWTSITCLSTCLHNTSSKARPSILFSTFIEPHPDNRVTTIPIMITYPFAPIFRVSTMFLPT